MKLGQNVNKIIQSTFPEKHPSSLSHQSNLRYLAPNFEQVSGYPLVRVVHRHSFTIDCKTDSPRALFRPQGIW